MQTPALDEVSRRVRGGGAGRLSLEVAVGRIGAYADRELERDNLIRLIHPVPITAPQIPLVGGAGTLNQPDLLGPHDGLYWDVRHITAAGFTAGTVNVYLNYQADENLKGTFPQPGILTYSGNFMLGDSDALIFVASGIVGAVTIGGQAYNIPAGLVPYYIL